VFHPISQSINPKDPVSLALLNWQRELSLPPGQRGTQSEVQNEVEVKANVSIPPALVQEGVEYRLPTFEAVARCESFPRTQPIPLDPPRQAHTDATYASWCKQLINCLSGSARSWALHEFFYSDVDRAW
jgi:hypothetical protein